MTTDPWWSASTTTGPASRPTERERVFDRFHRSEPSRDRASGGSGLGLGIARSIVELHGGRIWVEDSPLGGARRLFRLPGFAGDQEISHPTLRDRSSGRPAASAACIGPNEPTTRDGVAGNARLTGAVAAALLVLLAAEGATIPFIGQLLGPHIFIGMLLIPPVALKLGSTGYRFARYYTRQSRLCPQGAAARWRCACSAPGVVLTTLALFGTGVGAAGRRPAEPHPDLRPQAQLHRLGRADDDPRARPPARGAPHWHSPDWRRSGAARGATGRRRARGR